jgi:replicative DNA helicase
MTTIDEAEAGAIGACFHGPEWADKVCGVVNPEDFQGAGHRAIFAAIQDLNRHRHPIDSVSIHAATGGRVPQSKLLDLRDRLTTGAYGRHHASLVAAASRLRALGAAARELAEMVQKASLTPDAPDAILEALEAKLDEVRSRAPGAKPIKLADADPELLPQMRSRSPVPNGTPTGFDKLDAALGGLRDGELIVLAARPSVGKSLFAANVAENVVFSDNPLPVLFISLEMTSAALYRRYLFGRSQVSPADAYAGNIGHEEILMLEDSHERLKAAPWYVHYEARMTSDRLAAISRAFVNRHGKSLIVVDYLQLMKGTGTSRYEQVTNLSGDMKALAVDLCCPVLVLSQLSRAAADQHQRGAEAPVVVAPSLGDLRESGAIEQDADSVVFLWRDITIQGKHPCNMAVAKNRPGRTGKGQIMFNPVGPRFENAPSAEAFS